MKLNTRSHSKESEDKKTMLAAYRRRERSFRSLLVLVLIISLLVLAGVSYGWYALNRRTDNAIVNVVSDASGLRVGSYAIIKAEPTDGASTVSAAKMLSDTKIQLNDFDAVFAKNNSTPVYICIMLEGGDITEQTYSVTIKRAADKSSVQNGLYENNDDGKMMEYLSDIAQAQWATDDELDAILDSSDDADKRAVNFYNKAADSKHVSWNGLKSFYKYIPNAQGHGTTLGNDNVKNASMILNVRATADNDGKVRFYIKLDYCWPLVEAYVNMKYGESRRLDQSYTTQPFTGDITTIEIASK